MLGGINRTVFLLADLAYRLGVAVGRAASVTGDIALGDLADLAGFGGGAGGGGPIVAGGGDVRAVRKLDAAALAVGVAGVALLGAGSGLGVLDLRAAVVLIESEITVCLLADLTHCLGMAVGRTAGVDMSRAGFQLQLLIPIVCHMVTGYIGGEISGIVGFACGGEYAFTGPDADICAAGEGAERDDRQVTAIREAIRQIQVFGGRGRIRRIRPGVPGNDGGAGDADLADTAPLIAFHVDTAAVVALICLDLISSDRAAVQIQCAFCTHIDTAAVTGGCVLGNRAAVHVKNGIIYINAAAVGRITAFQCAAVHIKSGIIVDTIVNTDAVA